MSGNFLDSNIFIYLYDETDEEKRVAAEILILDLIETGQGCISFQVIQETLNVLTRKLAHPLKPEDAKRFLERIMAPLWKVSPSTDLYIRGLDIQERYQFGFYDSLIVAAALEAGCKT